MKRCNQHDADLLELAPLESKRELDASLLELAPLESKHELDASLLEPTPLESKYEMVQDKVWAKRSKENRHLMKQLQVMMSDPRRYSKKEKSPRLWNRFRHFGYRLRRPWMWKQWCHWKNVTVPFDVDGTLFPKRWFRILKGALGQSFPNVLIQMIQDYAQPYFLSVYSSTATAMEWSNRDQLNLIGSNLAKSYHDSCFWNESEGLFRITCPESLMGIRWEWMKNLLLMAEGRNNFEPCQTELNKIKNIVESTPTEERKDSADEVSDSEDSDDIDSPLPIRMNPGVRIHVLFVPFRDPLLRGETRVDHLKINMEDFKENMEDWVGRHLPSWLKEVQEFADNGDVQHHEWLKEDNGFWIVGESIPELRTRLGQLRKKAIRIWKHNQRIVQARKVLRSKARHARIRALGR